MKRLYSLDAIRGVAALSIVFWHWQHFFSVSGDFPDNWDATSQPFYGLFKVLYLQGWAAVDLFFALSGFVFFWLYREAIRDERITAKKFALYRFSRLWPLLALTLFAVLGLQWAFHGATGEFFIFPADSVGRFFANLFAVQQWLPPNIDQTFNGPAWTVSVEAGLYVLFFFLCRFGMNGPKTALITALAGILLFQWNWFIARGLIGFFLGGYVYFVVERVRLRKDARRISLLMAGMALALWAFVCIETLYGPLHKALYALAGSLSPGAGRFYIGYNGELFHLGYIFAVIPVSVAALALSEVVLDVLGPVYRRLSFLGDISYSTYMLHFPLQIACAVAAVHFGLEYPVFMHGYAMLGFYVVLIGLGALSFFGFEKPVQRMIRQRFAKD
jgi:peptidoglycan/LPS O-acetylase OafA/YrhL